MNITPNQCSFNIIYSFDADHDINGIPVSLFRRELAKCLAKQIQLSGKTYDHIIPIPNTGIFYGKWLAKFLGVNYLNPFKKRKKTRTLSLTRPERTDFYSRFLEDNGIAENIDRVLFVDEALISGTTLFAISSWAQKKSIKNFSFAVASPPMINYCPDRIIKDEERALEPSLSDIALTKRVNDFTLKLQCDDLFFVSSEEFNSIMTSNERCTLCFSRNYGKSSSRI